MLTNFHTKYKVECKIGEGSFSEVLKCQERSTGKLVAAKQLKKHFKSLNQAAEIPELMVLRKMSKHPNLLELYESYYDTSNGKVTLVFELMDMSLYDLMKTRKRPVPESRAKKYLYQIIKGIDHLHYHGIFHRDVKPENVLIKADKVKISDMGSIKGFYSKQPYTEYISTRWYRSPECLLTKGFYGPKMDIWAIGCVYYELLTLKPLFPGSDELDQIAKINQVLGSPSAKLLNKLKKVKCRNTVPSFPHKKGTGLNSVIPMMTEEGREIFKQMIVYDPDSRINVRRLLEHKYFNDMRHEEMLSQRLLSTQSVPAGSCRLGTSPMWLSFITATRKRRIKRKVSGKISVERKHSVQKTQSNMTRVSTTVSSEVSFSNNSDEAEGSSTVRVYAMQPDPARVVSQDDNRHEHQNKFYSVQPDRIPGYEQFTKRKLLQSLGSKALAGLGLLKNKEVPESNNQSFTTKSYNSQDKQSVNSKRRTFKSLRREMGQDSFHRIDNIDDFVYEKPLDENGMPNNHRDMQSQLYNRLETNRRLFSDRIIRSLGADTKTGGKQSSPLARQHLIIEEAPSLQPPPNKYSVIHPPKHANLEKTISSVNGKYNDGMTPRSTADMRSHISPKSLAKRKSYLTRLSDDEAVNLVNMGDRKIYSNVINRFKDGKLMRFNTGTGKMTSQLNYLCPVRRASSNIKVAQSLKKSIGEKTNSMIGLRMSSTKPTPLNMKQKEEDVVIIQNRLERIKVTGPCKNRAGFYRTTKL